MDNPKTNTALLVIDVQQGLFEKPRGIYLADQLLDTLNILITKARQANAAIIFIQHENDSFLVKESPAWHLHPGIQPLDSETMINKQHGNAFEGTDLQAELTNRGVDTVVITGLVTHGCVRATCLGALELGYKTILVSNGHSSFSKDAPKLIEKWNRTLGEKGAAVMSAEEVASNLGKNLA